MVDEGTIELHARKKSRLKRQRSDAQILRLQTPITFCVDQALSQALKRWAMLRPDIRGPRVAEILSAFGSVELSDFKLSQAKNDRKITPLLRFAQGLILKRCPRPCRQAVSMTSQNGVKVKVFLTSVYGTKLIHQTISISFRTNILSSFPSICPGTRNTQNSTPHQAYGEKASLAQGLEPLTFQLSGTRSTT